MTTSKNGVQQGHAAIALSVNSPAIEPAALGAWKALATNNTSVLLNVSFDHLTRLTLRDIRDPSSDLHDVITILDAGAAGYFVYAAVDFSTMAMLSGDAWDDMAKLVALAQAAGADYLHITDAPALPADAFDVHQET